MRAKLVAIALLVAAPASAQLFARADSLLAARDTNATIAELDGLIRKHSKNPETYFRSGKMYLIRARSRALSRENDGYIAVERFKDALRLAPDSGRYVVTLADLVRAFPVGFGDDVVVLGDDVVVLLVKSVDVLSQRVGAAAAPDIHYVARAFLDLFEIKGRRLLQTDAAQRPAAFGAISRPDFVWERDAPWSEFIEFLRDNVHHDDLRSSRMYREYAEEASRAALAVRPDFIDAAGLLIVNLAEDDRWLEANGVARALIQAAPDSGRAHALFALTLARTDRWRESQAAFARAFRLMTPAQHDPYRNLALVLSRADSLAYSRIPQADRATADSLFWSGQRPLYLSTANEAQVEYWARLTYVLHRWSEPARLYHGFQDPRGAVYLRWGPPQLMATLGIGTAAPATSDTTPPGARLGAGALPVDGVDAPRQIRDWREALKWQYVTAAPFTVDERTVAGGRWLNDRVVWAYIPDRIRFLFGIQLGVGYSRASFFWRSGQLYRETRDKHPLRFDNVPLVRGLDTIGVQIAQFQGAGDTDTTDVAVFTATPIGRMMRDVAPMDIRLVTAAFVKDSAFRSVTEEAVRETVRPGDSTLIGRPSFRLTLPPGGYRLRVESGMPALGRAARSSEPLAVRSFEGGDLMMSDILVAERAEPRDSAPARWTDFFINPSAGRFPPGAPISLLWEVYNLQPDSSGSVRYRAEVRFTVQNAERKGFTARITGGPANAIGLSARGEDQATISYERRLPAPGTAALVDYLSLDLQNRQEAIYEATVTVTDVHTGQVAASSRVIVVSTSPLRKAP